MEAMLWIIKCACHCDQENDLVMVMLICVGDVDKDGDVGEVYI